MKGEKGVENAGEARIGGRDGTRVKGEKGVESSEHVKKKDKRTIGNGTNRLVVTKQRPRKPKRYNDRRQRRREREQQVGTYLQARPASLHSR